MKPSVLSTSSTLTRSREAGVDTFDLLRICALWMRAIMSPSGSFIAIGRSSSPARLHQPWNQPLGAEVPQRDARQLELAVVAAWPPRHLAAIADAGGRRVARQLGELERRREPLLHRAVPVARNLLEPRAPAGILLGQLAPPAVLLNRALLRHQYLLAFRA